MRYLDVCAGISAATVAWSPLGYRALAYSEIDRFASAVLAHHYPKTPNWGDMTRFKDWPDATLDVLVGGTPCQSYSIAGLREGMTDPRGQLALVYLAIARRYRPQWLVWENVPGVHSTDKGRAFSAFITGLAELGYGFCWRVLDAQYFGLAQRRKRVFLVAYLGDWRPAAAVLLEPSSMRWDPPPSRQAREGVAGTLEARARGGSGAADRTDKLIHELAGTVTGDSSSGRSYGSNPIPENLIAFGANDTRGARDIAGAVRAKPFHGDFESETFLVGVAPSLDARAGRSGMNEFSTSGGLIPEIASTLVAGGNNTGGNRPPGSSAEQAVGQLIPVIAFDCRQDPINSTEVFGALSTNHRQAQAVALRGRDGGNMAELGDDVMHAMRTMQGGSDKPHVLTGMRVRRLTPRECERLQGLPDGYTLIPYPKKLAKDSPRYKAIGNSIAVPVLNWIGRRMLLVDEIKRAA